MIVTYRYKLKPTRAQYAELARLLELQRLLYNAALQERGEAWRKAKLTISRMDQQKSLTEVRSFDADYAAMPANISRWSLAKVEDAMAGFFSRVKRGQKPGFPRYRGKGCWRSFGFAEFVGIRLREGRLLFRPFSTGVRLRMDRPLPEGAVPKAATFTRHGRHWWVTMPVEVPAAEAHRFPDAVVGLDVGIESLVTTSDGEHIPNARPRSRRERDLRIAQRALARCKRGSKRCAKVRERVALLQRRIANVRANHLHQVSAAIAKRYCFIAVEDLKLRNMTRSAKGTLAERGTNVRQKAGLNRALLDAAPGRLINLITYKAERAGGLLVKVDPRKTSITCSACGEDVPKGLSQRRHRCACGADLHRDHNAAANILQRALAAHGRGRPPGDANVEHQLERRPGTTVPIAA